MKINICLEVTTFSCALAVLVILSCGGVKESIDDNGTKIIGEYDWLRRRDGNFISYYQNGLVRDSLSYSNNVLHGFSSKFDSLGRKTGIIKYNYGSIVYSKTYFANGELNRYEENLNDREKAIIQFQESGYPLVYQWAKNGEGKYLKTWDENGFMDICVLPLRVDFGDSICVILEHSQLDSSRLRSIVKLILNDDILSYRRDTVYRSEETPYFNNGKLIQLIQRADLPTFSSDGLKVCFPAPENIRKFRGLYLEYGTEIGFYVGVAGWMIDLDARKFELSPIWMNPR
jgi:hypothetical protein